MCPWTPSVWFSGIICVLIFAGCIFTGPQPINAQLTAPTLTHPANNQLGYVQNPHFTWSSVSNAVGYDIQVAADSTFTTIVVSDFMEVPRFVPKAPLFQANRFWRVRARDAANNPGPWSATFIYQLRAPTYTQSIPAGATLTDIRSAIATAVANTPALVQFAAGATYYVDPPYPNEKQVILLENAGDLIIDGNNAKFIIQNPNAGLIRMNNCSRITVRKLTLEHNPIPHSIGVVEAVDHSLGRITLRRLPGYPNFNDQHMLDNWTWGSLLDPARRGWLKNGVESIFSFSKSSLTQIGSDQFTVDLLTKGFSSRFALNDQLILFARNNTQSLFSINKGSTDITFDRITNYTAPSGHYSLIDTNHVKILDCHSKIKDTTRWFAGNADGVHCRANPTGPWIEGCSFEGVGDDGIALYNKGLFVLEQDQVNWNKVTVPFNDLMHFQVGDSFRFFNPRDGVMIGDTYQVTTVVTNPQNSANRDITFTPALTSTLTVNQAVNSDQLFNLSRRNNMFVIRNNQFTGIRRFGTVVRSTNGLIKGNTYTGASRSAIALLNEAVLWHNGLYSVNLQILSNQTDFCGFESSAAKHGDIHVIINATQATPTARLHSNIRIENNTIQNYSERGISVENAINYTVKNNIFRATRSDFSLAGPNYGIYINNTTGRTVSGNDFSGDTRPLQEPKVFVTASNN